MEDSGKPPSLMPGISDPDQPAASGRRQGSHIRLIFSPSEENTHARTMTHYYSNGR